MPSHAWQPFTPRGVAAFAAASLSRLLVGQLIVAALVACGVVWALRVAWWPVIDQAIQQLPATGFIQRGVLNFPAESPQRLAENSHLGLAVDLDGARTAGQSADVD